MTEKTSPNTGALVSESNPLGIVLNSIPWEFVIIGPVLLDLIAGILMKPMGTIPSNKAIMHLLEMLHNGEFVHLHAIPSDLGVTYIIKRI